ncbi:MAG: DMT family transporter [Planctomycetota bacterium]|nr:DMT family transporter [Planctomycetota bacterium]
MRQPDEGGGVIAGRAMVLGAALLWSTAGAAIKYVSVEGSEIRAGLQIAGCRSLIAGLALLPLAGRGVLRLDRTAGVTAIAYAFTVTSFALANRLTTAANAIFIQDSGLLFLLILGPWLLKEKNRAADYAAIVALLAGLAILVFMDGAEEDKPMKALGNVVALFSALTFALTIAGLRANREGNPATPVIWGNFLAAAMCAPAFYPFMLATPRNAAAVAYLGVFQLGLSYFLFSRGIRRLSAVEAAIVSFVEPVLNPVWTYLLCNEIPGHWALLGCAVIAFTVLTHSVVSAIGKRRAQPAAGARP